MSSSLFGCSSPVGAWAALGYVVAAGIVAFLARMLQIRLMFRRVQKEHGILMMPHSLIFGHFLALAKIAIKYKQPRDAHGHEIFHFIKLEYPELAKKGVIYMDTWPFAFPLLAVFHPDIQAQFTQEDSLPKFWAQGHSEFKPFTNGEDIVHLEGQEWKLARAMFNPGFSARNLLSMVPEFVEETLVFRDRLKKAAASGEVVKLENYTTDITVDIISRAVLGKRLQVQTNPKNTLMNSMTAQLEMVHLQLDLKKELNPLVPIKHWYYNRIVRRELMPYILDTVRNYEKIEGPKTILALAFKSYITETGGSSSAANNIPPSVIERAIKHIKMFTLAGHETTATTLAYMYYLLSLHPDALAKTRAEHDEVLGPDPANAAELLCENPALLNSMPYTVSVMKETLRLYPPVGGTIRQSPPGHFLVHPETGERFPTHGFMIHDSAIAVQRDPEFWPQADAWIPDRWMVRDEADPMHPLKNAWRPFEMGPRNCIGQELANLELRLILALTIREFDIVDAYPEDAPTWTGIKGYQIQSADKPATAHIKGELPVTVKLRQQ